MPVQGWLPKKEEEMNVIEKLKMWEETHISHKGCKDLYTIVGDSLSRKSFLCELVDLEEWDEDKYMHPIEGYCEALRQIRNLRKQFPRVKYTLYRLREAPEILED